MRTYTDRDRIRDLYRYGMNQTPLYDYDESLQGFRAIPIDSRRSPKDIGTIIFAIIMCGGMVFATIMGILAASGYFD